MDNLRNVFKGTPEDDALSKLIEKLDKESPGALDAKLELEGFDLVDKLTKAIADRVKADFDAAYALVRKPWHELDAEECDKMNAYALAFFLAVRFEMLK